MYFVNVPKFAIFDFFETCFLIHPLVLEPTPHINFSVNGNAFQTNCFVRGWQLVVNSWIVFFQIFFHFLPTTLCGYASTAIVALARAAILQINFLGTFWQVFKGIALALKAFQLVRCWCLTNQASQKQPLHFHGDN